MKIRWRKPAYVALYFGLATVFMTWPAVLHLTTSVLGRLGDNMHFAWLMGWFDQAIFQDHRWPYFAPQLNFPEGWHLARSETTPLQAAMGLPFTWLGGPVLAYNVVALLTFFLSGVAAFSWVRKLTGNDLAGMISGTLFAFLPFRMAHFRAGHLNIMGTMWFPLFFMALFTLLKNGKASRGEAILGGIGLGLISLTSMYLFYVTVVIAALASTAYLLIFRRRSLVSRAFWIAAGRLGFVAAPLVAIAVLPYLELTTQDSLPDRTVQGVSLGSASVSDFLLPSTDHFLWGQWVADHFSRQHWIEGTLYIGVVAGGLGIIALAAGRKQWRDEIILLVITLIVSGALTLGTHLYWDEQLVRIKLPDAVGSLVGRQSTAIPMPGYFLFQTLPFYAKMRTFKRAGALVLLGTSTLAGLGAAWILKRVNRKARALCGGALLGLVLLDFYPGPFAEFSDVRPRTVDLWLADQPGEGAVAEFPFELQEEQSHVFFSLTHGKPILGGFFNAFPPPQYRRIKPLMAEFPSASSIEALGDLGVEYILIDSSQYENFWALKTRLEQYGWTERVRDGTEVIFQRR